jgi:uncharacterized protein (TIGR02099 family)
MSLIPPNVSAAFWQRAVSASRSAPLRGLARLVFGLVIAAWMVLVAAWLALHWIILPHIQEWRVPMAERIGQAIGLEVRIGRIEVRSGGWVPAFELGDVELLDARQHVVLRLPHVAAAFSPRSLLALEPRFSQLLIDGPQLEIRRDRQGRIWVAGLDVGGDGEAGADSGAVDWFFRQREFAIRGGRLRWIDEQRGAAPLQLDDVQLVIRNSTRRHAFRFDATPPAGWGERFSLRARMTQPIWAPSGDWRHWSGTVYTELPRADVQRLSHYVALPFELNEGDGALRSWIDVIDGEPRTATVDLALRAVALRLEATTEPLVFQQVEGRIVAQRNDAGYAVAVQDFGFLTGDGLSWPRSDMRVAWLQSGDQPVSGGSVTAQRLDIGVMAQIAGRVPIGEAMRKLLAQLDPQGTVSDFDATWQGPIDAPQRYHVGAQMSGLSFVGHAGATPHEIGRPGLRNASIRLDATETGGSAQIGIDAGAVEIPGLFADPVLALDALSARLQWTIETQSGAPPRVSVQARDVQFVNHDAKGEVTADWNSGSAPGERFPGHLRLDGKVGSAKAARVARYLPLELPEETRQYVERAVRSGMLSNLSFHIDGALSEFPFFEPRQRGEFRIATKIDDVTLAYMPPDPSLPPAEAGFVWPVMTQVGGELVIDRARLSIRNARGRLGGVEWSGVQGGIANLAAQAPVLEVDGAGRGPLDEMLHFVDSTPVGGWIGGALAGATGNGPLELKLGLTIPLADAGATTVKGSLMLGGNDVRMSPETPLLAGARGRVDFTERDFTVQRVSARALGGEFSLSGGMREDGSLHFSGQGNATALALRGASELGTIARVAQALQGQASYRFELGFVQGQPQIDLTSNLVGLTIELPYPLEKTAATPLEMRYRTAVSGKAGAPLHEALDIDIGQRVRLQYLRELDGTAVKVLSGGIGVMADVPQPAQTIAATVKLPHLDVDAWEAAALRLFGPAPAAAASAAAAKSSAAAAQPSGDITGAAADYMPTRVALEVDELTAASRHFNHVVAGISEEGGEWRASVEADEFNGYIEYRPTRSGAGRIYARLGRLSLPKSEVERVESLLDRPPTSVPALDIVVDAFELRGMHLGRAEIVASNRRSAPGAPLEWQLSRLSLAMPEAEFVATGRWAPTTHPAPGTPPRRADLSFKLTLANGGALLDRLGFEKMLRGGKGQLSGDISWPGSPLSPDIAHMVGKMHVAITSGQFLQAEPGVARLLGVLSLQSLPRRLLLDFRDVFDKGFAFDDIDGDVQLADGVARTNNLRMRSVVVAVLMEGSADIVNEKQDLRVVVVPEINAGAASLAYAVINPAVGLGTFLAQLFLRKPLIAASTREFHISGSWSEPKVEKVERPLFGAARGASAPASSASAASAPAVPASAAAESAGSEPAGSKPAGSEPAETERVGSGPAGPGPSDPGSGASAPAAGAASSAAAPAAADSAVPAPDRARRAESPDESPVAPATSR